MTKTCDPKAQPKYFEREVGISCIIPPKLEAMTPKSAQLLRCLLILPPLAAFFIGLPGALTKMLFVQFATSPRVLPLWLEAGLPGYIFGYALALLVFQLVGMIIGFCIGIFVFSRFMSKGRLLFWLLQGRQIRGYSKFVEGVVNLAYR